MSHKLGLLITEPPLLLTFDESNGIDLVPPTGTLGNPRYVILFFDNVDLSPGAKLTVDLGYGIDEFSSGSGSSFWTRPANTYNTNIDPPGVRPVPIRITAGSGSARLLQYGLAQPTQTGNPPGDYENLTNPDPFFHTNPYQEPVYETRVECTSGFAWQNTAVPQNMLPIPGVQAKVSSCNGTLIGPDMFLTGRRWSWKFNHGNF